MGITLSLTFTRFSEGATTPKPHLCQTQHINLWSYTIYHNIAIIFIICGKTNFKFVENSRKSKNLHFLYKLFVGIIQILIYSSSGGTGNKLKG